MRFLRPLLGLALLAGLISFTEPRALLETFQRADLSLFTAALLLSILANLVCVYRWQSVASELDIQAPYSFLLSAYAQGLSANSVLPGGIVGGDAWRSISMSKSCRAPKTQSALTVLLDRISGFWGLTCLSLSAGLVATFISDARAIGELNAWFDSSLGRAYLLALLVIAASPIMGRWIHSNWLSRYECEHRAQQIGKWARAVIQIINALPILKKTFLLSVLVQLLSATAFWLCLQSVHTDISWWLLTALCGGIFLSSILPAALGGFGARELGAVAFITPFGFGTEGILVGSILFGLTGTIQGGLGLWFWLRAQGSEHNNPPPAI